MVFLIRQMMVRVVALALVLAALLPFYASYGVQAGDDLSSIFGDKILICTAEGYQWIDVADLGDVPHDDSAAKCPLCVVAAFGYKGLLLDASVGEVVVFDVVLALADAVDSVDIPTFYALEHSAARAPPAPVFS